MRSSTSLGLFVATVLVVLGCATGGHAPMVSAAAELAPESTLILISLDGFRWDYLVWAEASNLSRLAAAGVRA